MNDSIERPTSTSNDGPAQKQQNGENKIAIAIDFDSQIGDCNNPCIKAVPKSLDDPQEILKLIYKKYIAEELGWAESPEDVPYYRFSYLWHGELVGKDGVQGGESTENFNPIHPPDELTFYKMVEEVRKELEGKDK